MKRSSLHRWRGTVAGCAVLACLVGTSTSPVSAADPNADPPVAAAVTEADSNETMRLAGLFAATADEEGATGIYYDWTSSEYVAVMPPSTDGLAGRRDALSAIGVSFRIEMRGPTRSNRDLLRQVLEKYVTQPGNEENRRFSAYFDARTGKTKISGFVPTSLFATLQDSFPGEFNYQPGSNARLTRTNDSAPHWGGAAIGLVRARPLCTSSFTVNKSGAGRAMVTAGHCFGVDQSPIGPGGLIWGRVTTRASFPTYDFEMITGTSYSGSIYTGGESGTQSAVKGAGDPVVGPTNYCMSGMVTFEHCGHHVVTVDGLYCDDQNRCTNHVAIFEDGATKPQPGDSGSPLYNVPSGVWIRGIVIGGIHIEQPDWQAAVQRWGTISLGLGVTIVTS